MTDVSCSRWGFLLLEAVLIEYYSVPSAVTNDAFVEGGMEGVYFPFQRRLRGAVGEPEDAP